MPNGGPAVGQHADRKCVGIRRFVAERLMTIAYESGVNLFDTAEVYAAGKAEVILGSIIKKKGWRIEGLPPEAAARVVHCRKAGKIIPLHHVKIKSCLLVNYQIADKYRYALQSQRGFGAARVGAMTWSPLACGIISGKYGNGVPESSRASLKCYQWLKERIVSEEGRKQQNKLKDLSPIAERLGCTLPQLAVGKAITGEGQLCWMAENEIVFH
ncbi:potassium voltage-gated channel, shaker-related subfamily, beta member 2 isoform 2 isoform 5-like protein [Camelus ferus]|nr:potassium voltage-gated channel, shaker-related subfamily, beta member 2 isoform 2 isoform 5-like protein [Camelus ferus]